MRKPSSLFLCSLIVPLHYTLPEAKSSVGQKNLDTVKSPVFLFAFFESKGLSHSVVSTPVHLALTALLLLALHYIHVHLCRTAKGRGCTRSEERREWILQNCVVSHVLSDNT